MPSSHGWIERLPLHLSCGSMSPWTDLYDDSRAVTPGSAFILRSTLAGDREQYLRDAIARGAKAIIANAEPTPAHRQAHPHIAWLTTDSGREIDQSLAGEIAEAFYDHPSRRLKLVGITGTNGKSTTAILIQHLLAEAGVRCGLIGTIFTDDGLTRRASDLTTPGAVDFSRLLAAMVNHGCTAAVAEMSSHGLHQGRTAALDVDVAVFTNLTGDHLDYHKTMDAYADAKAILFERLKPEGWAVVNSDDAWAARMLQRCRAQVLGCSVQAGEHRQQASRDGVTSNFCRAQIRELAAGHSRAVFDGPWGSVEAELPLVGRHNVENALQAIAAAHVVAPLGQVLRRALAQCPGVPGRLQRVRTAASDPVVLVDYAHTHDALENVLLAMRRVMKPGHGRLIVLFGCGGDRDRTKRPKMAAVACKLADRIYITSDNPRTESPDQIFTDILAGVPADAQPRVSLERDRATAIAQAVSEAGEEDVVLLAGKGHEDYQIIGSTRHHFDDCEQARAALQLRAAKWKQPCEAGK